jgi:hypothetical protein
LIHNEIRQTQTLIKSLHLTPKYETKHKKHYQEIAQNYYIECKSINKRGRWRIGEKVNAGNSKKQ